MDNDTPLDLNDIVDEIVKSPIKADSKHNPLRDVDTELSAQELKNMPGMGMGLVCRKVPVPLMPPKRGKKMGKVGKPKHVPTDKTRNYVVDAMVIEGKRPKGVARALGIHYCTLTKYYSDEMDIAEDLRLEFMDDTLYRNALKSALDPAYNASMIAWYKRHGYMRDKMDITSNGETIESNNFIVVPSVKKQDKTVVEGEVIDEDIPEIE